MAWSFQGGSYTLAPIATTGDRFRDFAPFVASINDHGMVAFQARLRRGETGVYAAGNGTLTTIVEAGPDRHCEVSSHPDINCAGSVCFYGGMINEENAVYFAGKGRLTKIATVCGPLGPTMNESGSVAFRGRTAQGGDGIYVYSETGMITVAETGAEFSAFLGLPVINGSGAVVFRADVSNGRQGIYLFEGGRTTTVVTSGDEFASLGSFPIINDEGVIAFGATSRDARTGVCLAESGGIEQIAKAGDGFESMRGVLLNNAGKVVFFGTPTDGTLGIYSGPDPADDRVIAVGFPLDGSSVTDFALNPVSINNRGQLAIRVALADGRQLILRADPVGVEESP